jgi:hypothetical protein
VGAEFVLADARGGSVGQRHYGGGDGATRKETQRVIAEVAMGDSTGSEKGESRVGLGGIQVAEKVVNFGRPVGVSWLLEYSVHV